MDFDLSEFFSLFFASIFSLRHLESISQVLETDCSNVFAFTLTPFLMVSFQESSSWSRTSNYA